MAQIPVSIAVSPSGTTLLAAQQVTNTAATVVFNEVVTLGDAGSGNVGSVLASGAQLVEPGGVNTQPVSGTITANAGTGTLAVNLAQVAGAAPSATNPEFVRLTDGTTAITAAVSAWGVAPTGTEVQGVNSNVFVAGTLAVAAATGVQKVGITGNAGATLDSAIGPASAPTNGIAVLGTYKNSLPAPSNSQSLMLQMDYGGSLFVKPLRRSESVAQATTIASSSSATTVLAAQATGIFADISNLIITVTPAATTNLAFTATLSDGTNSYIYDMDTGGLATSVADPTQININFNPPLPATSAATAWTIALSVATVTVHITVVAVLQKAS
jgi:hypothetical protein